MEDIRVCIIGGYGGMGQLFTRFFRDNGCEVVITGPNQSKGEKAADELGAAYITDNKKAVSKSNVVVVTVPIRKTIDVIKDVAPCIVDGSLLMDLTSIKEEPVRAMTENVSDGVEVVGCHPVFGPRQSVEGQVFVLTPVKKGGWYRWLKGLLEENRAKVITASPREHDEVMAVVQGLTHFTYISIGKTIQEIGFNVKESRKFSSPIYDLMLDMVGRIIGQDPRLYAEIQMNNPRVREVHERYLETASRISRIVGDADEKSFVKEMAKAARHYGDTESAMGRSDKAINALVYELKKLKDMRGEKVCVRHIYSGVMHYGVVDDVDAETLTLIDGGKRRRLRLSNIRLTSAGEEAEFRAEKYGVVERDYSVLVPGVADPERLGEIITSMVDVDYVEVKDVYNGEGIPEGKQSVCFRVGYYGDSFEDSKKDVQDLFSNIGWERR